MRAKVASKAGGHVFEERFMKLNGIQLAIAYRQALREEKEEFTLKKELNEFWVKQLETLRVFVNPEMYQALQEMKEMQKHAEEITPDDFKEIWDEMMEVLPSEVYVEEETEDPLAAVPRADPEIKEMITGFVTYKQKLKEGD